MRCVTCKFQDPFEYERATSVEHAVGLLDRLGEEARIVAGGHSLLPMMKLRLANPEYLIDINDLTDELGTFAVEPTRVRIGAMVRHRQILESDDLAAVCPIFRDAERVIADPVVRNRGTIGGSLCQADPAEDLTTVCSVLDATCVVRGPGRDPRDRDRRFPASVRTRPRWRPTRCSSSDRDPLRLHASSAYEKVERRAGDWAVAAAGAAVVVDGDTIAHARIGLTAVDPDRAAVAAIGEFLAGKPTTEETYVEAGRMAVAGLRPADRHARQHRVQTSPRLRTDHPHPAYAPTERVRG